MSRKQWLCKGPRGIQGEGVVSNHWIKCFNNHIPSIGSKCENDFNTELEAKNFCYQSLTNEIDKNPNNFNPEKYSCIINRNKTKCNGKYTSIFQKTPLQPNYHGGASGNFQGMELYIMDIDNVYETYQENIKQKNEELSAKEQQRILMEQLKQQDLEQKRKEQKEREERRRLFRTQLENEIRSEMKEDIQNQLFGIDNEVLQNLKKEQQFQSDKKFQKLQQDIKRIHSNIQKHQHIDNLKENEKLLNQQMLNEKLLNQQMLNERQLNEKLLNEIKQDQLKNEALLKLLIQEKQPKSMKQLLDDAENFLLKILTEPTVEPFSKKKCLWNYTPLIILIAIIVVLLIKH